MKNWYSFKYQENAIRNFIKKYKNYLDYTDMAFGTDGKYTYSKKHGWEFLNGCRNFMDKDGIHIFYFNPVFREGDRTNKRIKLWLGDQFYNFTDKRFEQFVEKFVKDFKRKK